MPERSQVLGIAWKVAIGTLGAAATFATVASIFGGGWQGYLAAIVAFLLIFGLVLLLARPKGPTSGDVLSREGATMEPIVAQPETIPATVSAEIYGSPPIGEGSKHEEPEPQATSPRTSGLVCDPGPYEVEGASILEIELDVRRGERVRGHLAELDGDDFDWHIVNERNLVALRAGEEFSEVKGEEHVTATSLQWKVSRDGPWFLVLDTYGRSNPRVIRVNLRRY